MLVMTLPAGIDHLSGVTRHDDIPPGTTIHVFSISLHSGVKRPDGMPCVTSRPVPGHLDTVELRRPG